MIELIIYITSIIIWFWWIYKEQLNPPINISIADILLMLFCFIPILNTIAALFIISDWLEPTMNRLVAWLNKPRFGIDNKIK